MTATKLRIALFSTLYPNGVRPGHGIFVETRLRHLLESGGAEARVIAPVPWFPFRHARFGNYSHYAAIPAAETHNGIPIVHPRYLVLPKIGMNLSPHTLARAGLAAARRLAAAGYDFDLIDAHYFFPDGVAAMMIGKAMNKPVVITARGTDINLIPDYSRPRAMIVRAARECAAIVTVSAALKDAAVRLGIDVGKISVLRNGVDLALFHPEDRQAARAQWKLTGFVVASVGNLIPTKGHDLAIQALTRMEDAILLVAGHGSEERSLRELAARLGVTERVRFLGAMPQSRLRTVYAAADCLVLASVREGWPNVLLEAMACGTPVVASRVGGVPEIVAVPESGLVVEERSVKALVNALETIRCQPPDRSATRAYAENFGWDATTAGQLAIFRRIVAPAVASDA